jgi:hypothetical protein
MEAMNGAEAPLAWGAVIVPWPTMWSGEEGGPLTVRTVKIAGKKLPFLCEEADRPGDGRPRLGQLHTGRVLHLVANHLCQICAKPLRVELSPAVVFSTGETQIAKPLIRDGLPMHEDCAATALTQCPHLRGLALAGVLRVWRAWSWQVSPRILGRTPVEEGGDERVNAALEASKTPLFSAPSLVLGRFVQVKPELLLAAITAGAETQTLVADPTVL